MDNGSKEFKSTLPQIQNSQNLIHRNEVRIQSFPNQPQYALQQGITLQPTQQQPAMGTSIQRVQDIHGNNQYYNNPNYFVPLVGNQSQTTSFPPPSISHSQMVPKHYSSQIQHTIMPLHYQSQYEHKQIQSQRQPYITQQLVTMRYDRKENGLNSGDEHSQTRGRRSFENNGYIYVELARTEMLEYLGKHKDINFGYLELTKQQFEEFKRNEKEKRFKIKIKTNPKTNKGSTVVNGSSNPLKRPRTSEDIEKNRIRKKRKLDPKIPVIRTALKTPSIFTTFSFKEKYSSLMSGIFGKIFKKAPSWEVFEEKGKSTFENFTKVYVLLPFAKENGGPVYVEGIGSNRKEANNAVSKLGLIQMENVYGERFMKQVLLELKYPKKKQRKQEIPRYDQQKQKKITRNTNLEIKKTNQTKSSNAPIIF